MFNSLILNLTKRLYPKGRAFRMPFGGVLEDMNKGLIISENEAITSAISVLDSILPDNNNFTIDDATDWERRLGIISNISTSLTDRKRAILRKMNHPGTIKARQHYLYLERELRAAGFNVYVYENRYLADPVIDVQCGIAEMGVAEMGGTVSNPDKYEVKDPRSFSTGLSDMGVAEMGVAEMGGGINYSLIANYIDENLDETFFDSLNDFVLPEMGVAEMGVAEMGGTFTYLQALRSSFFIAGVTATDMANILLNRKEEFRQLVLRIKPVQSVGILLINYVNTQGGPDYNDDYNNDYNI